MESTENRLDRRFLRRPMHAAYIDNRSNVLTNSCPFCISIAPPKTSTRSAIGSHAHMQWVIRTPVLCVSNHKVLDKNRIPLYPMQVTEEMMHGYSMNKDDYLKRLRRIEGQVRGIQRMVDEDQYCIDVLTQISSINKAMQGVAVGLLNEHLHHCVTNAIAEGGAEADAKIAEATAAIERLVKS